jgi:hypothetical protein
LNAGSPLCAYDYSFGLAAVFLLVAAAAPVPAPVTRGWVGWAQAHALNTANEAVEEALRRIHEKR